MRDLVPAIAAVVIPLAGSAALAEELPALKVVKVEIVPNSAKDLNDAFFRGRPILEVAPTPEKDGERLQLPTYRSYRFIATIHIGEGKAPASFLVRTECVRDGKTVILGQTRIALEDRLVQYACYNVFPAEAGRGDCMIRTVVEADKENKGLEFKATIVGRPRREK
jgi:hypothetical protein